MTYYTSLKSNKNKGSKEPQLDVSSVWEQGEEDEVKGVFSVKGEQRRGEYWLWQSVVAQALQDAASCSRDRKMKSVRAEAIAWFSMENHDFLFVCELAGLEPKEVLLRAKEVIAQSKEEQKHKTMPTAYYTKRRWKWFDKEKRSDPVVMTLEHKG